MPQVISEPDDIRRFVAALRQFNNEVHTSTNRIRAHLRSLGGSCVIRNFTVSRKD